MRADADVVVVSVDVDNVEAVAVVVEVAGPLGRDRAVTVEEATEKTVEAEEAEDVLLRLVKTEDRKAHAQDAEEIAVVTEVAGAPLTEVKARRPNKMAPTLGATGKDADRLKIAVQTTTAVNTQVARHAVQTTTAVNTPVARHAVQTTTAVNTPVARHAAKTTVESTVEAKDVALITMVVRLVDSE